MVKKYFKIINMIIIILLTLMVIFFVDCICEKNIIDKKILEFKNRGEYVYQNDIYTYYKVKKTHQYEDTSNILNKCEDMNVGTVGDVYLTNRNPIKGFFVTDLISKISYIGHGGMIYNQKGTQMIEIVGNKGLNKNKVEINYNDWLKIDSPTYIVLRSKSIDDNKKDILKKESQDVLGCRYNYTLISNNKTFYCTDLISYLYKKININLNKDYFFTTGSDIITNNDMYMIYYRERYIKNNKICYNIYYLSEE